MDKRGLRPNINPIEHYTKFNSNLGKRLQSGFQPSSDIKLYLAMWLSYRNVFAAYTRGSEHPAHGPIGQVSEPISVGLFYNIGKKLR